MKRPVSALGVLLAAQLVLAGGLAAASAYQRRAVPRGPLLAFDPKSVDGVLIEGPAGARVELARAGGAWKVSSAAGFPAQAGKADELLTRLAGLRHGEPVATSAGALSRFKVADGDFERRITLSAGGKAVATAFFGTAEAMRSVHARAAGGKDVELVEFSTWDAPATADDWVDRTVLRIPEDQIEAVDVNSVTLERVAPAPPAPSAKPATPAIAGGPALPDLAKASWRATGLPQGGALDPKAAAALVSAVAGMSFTGLAGGEPAGGFGLDHPALVVGVRRTGGARVEYRLAHPAGGADWILASSTRPERFRMAGYAAEALQKDADPGTLSGHPPKPPPPAPPATAASAAKPTAKR